MSSSQRLNARFLTTDLRLPSLVQKETLESSTRRRVSSWQSVARVIDAGSRWRCEIPARSKVDRHNHSRGDLPTRSGRERGLALTGSPMPVEPEDEVRVLHPDILILLEC